MNSAAPRIRPIATNITCSVREYSRMRSMPRFSPMVLPMMIDAAEAAPADATLSSWKMSVPYTHLDVYKRQVRRCVANIIYIGTAFAAVMTLITAPLTTQILELMGTKPELMEDAYDYLFWIFVGLAAQMMYNLLAGILRLSLIHI